MAYKVDKMVKYLASEELPPMETDVALLLNYHYTPILIFSALQKIF